MARFMLRNTESWLREVVDGGLTTTQRHYISKIHRRKRNSVNAGVSDVFVTNLGGIISLLVLTKYN